MKCVIHKRYKNYLTLLNHTCKTNQMGQLIGKHILVTGASSGMGRVFCKMIANEGACVSLLARDENRLSETISLMQGSGHKYYVCDLTDESQIMSVINQIDK